MYRFHHLWFDIFCWILLGLFLTAYGADDATDDGGITATSSESITAPICNNCAHELDADMYYTNVTARFDADCNCSDGPAQAIPDRPECQIGTGNESVAHPTTCFQALQVFGNIRLLLRSAADPTHYEEFARMDDGECTIPGGGTGFMLSCVCTTDFCNNWTMTALEQKMYELGGRWPDHAFSGAISTKEIYHSWASALLFLTMNHFFRR